MNGAVSSCVNTVGLGFMVSTDKSVAMIGFFDEVKRRKVYRVAAAYIIAAGGIIQLASAAFPAWELPNWALRLVIVCLLMGFPIALILAWAYDITAQGVQATPDASACPDRTSPKHNPAHQRRDHFRRGRVLSAATRLGPQVRQVDRSVAV